MKQLLQSMRTGEIAVEDVPVPQVLSGFVLVRNRASLVSAGTERAVTEFASKNLLEKSRSRPDLVRQVLDKARREGIATTFNAVRNRLDQAQPLGYSSAGVVLAVGGCVTDIQVGDAVACAGAGYASHAEVISVPRLLVAKLSVGSADQQMFEQAAFTTVASVAMHGVRLAQVGLGDVVAVIGLGLVGQITVQLLRAAGCRVIGSDLQQDRVALALKLGAEAAAVRPQQMQDVCAARTSGRGVDAAVITAETPSSSPVELAGAIARDRGVVVAVGTVGMDIPRKLYFKKELEFRVSRSYGPGRYDTDYEEKGRDYPFGFVRWTENRNMEAVLELIATGRLDLRPLISHRFPVDDALTAYELITGKRQEQFLGVLITYAADSTLATRVEMNSSAPAGDVKVGMLGAGLFATGVLLPAIQQTPGVALVGVCTATGLKARHAATKFGFRFFTTDEQDILASPELNTVVIATRHDLHARQVIAALDAGKHVFCEKPLCIRESELIDIIAAARCKSGLRLMVGYNRRFAGLARQLKEFFAKTQSPLVMNYRVNAGFLPRDHWTQDANLGGGRVLGEVCHFVDFLSFLCGARPMRVHARALPDAGRYSNDNLVATIEFANGSVGTITYVANGDKAFPKERVEVFGGGAVGALDDFRELELVQGGKRETVRSRLKQDKGHAAECAAFFESVRSGGPAPIEFDQIVATSVTTFLMLDSLRVGEVVDINTAEFLAPPALREVSSTRAGDA